MGLTSKQLLDLIQRSPRAYQLVRGYVAEWHLERHLVRLKRARKIDSYKFINVEGEPDFAVTVRGFTRRVECKNLLRGHRYADGDGKIDFQRTRAQLGETARTGRYYKVADFEIVAACLYNQTGKWEFLFARTRDLVQIDVDGVRCLEKAVRVPLGPPRKPWVTDLAELFPRRRG